ncbi:MAG: DNA-directed RNA polymerase subunit B [Candidatus Heimdallarchaeota archaeon]|nr:DNA-directed RNA polymerase subunit B [Candidatus Heimdallarchaeota archaeon]
MSNENKNFTPDEKWLILEAMFDEIKLVRQHLDSYNHFVTTGLQQVIEEERIIELDSETGYNVELKNIILGKPKIKEADGSESDIWPMDARIRNLTYSAPLELVMIPKQTETADQQNEKRKRTTTIGGSQEKRYYIGHLPIMLRSKHCRLDINNPSDEILIDHGEDPKDPGGYFIVNGTERVLVTQEDLAPNRILVERLNNGNTLAKVFSSMKGFRAPVSLERANDGTLKVSFPSVPRKISLLILLRALGLEKEGAISRRISSSAAVYRQVLNLVRGEEIRTKDAALDFIGRRVAVGQTQEYRVSRTEQVLDRYLLPHLGNNPEDRIKKAHFLCLMAQKVLELEVGEREPDDKDHYASKRLNLAGDLLLLLFRNAFRSLTRDIKYQLERNINKKGSILKTAVRADVITERLRHALATGNWVGGKAGVSQLLDRTNYMSALSHLRRVVSPLSRSQPHFEARDLHPTHWGKICPNETPEGPNCGLVKNLALQAYISIDIDSSHVLKELLDLDLIVDVEKILRTFNFDENRIDGKPVTPLLCRVYHNGELVGFHEDGEQLAEQVRKGRRNRLFSPGVNIAFYSDTNEIYINSDHGRVRRPLIIVKSGESALKHEHIEQVRQGIKRWGDLERQGLIEYLDSEEEENALIAIKASELTMQHTHLEISPATILGICASLIPFPEHNRSDRNVYESGMAKQSLGIYAANFKLRLDTRAHILHYPQIPMVKTHGMKAIGFNERPAGQNFIVAVLSYNGYNMEDALIMNKSSVDRGLGRSTFFRSYDAEERRYPGGQEDKFEKPTENVRGYRASEVYRHLSEDGVVEPETEVSGKLSEVIIGRTSPPRFSEASHEYNIHNQVRRDTSVNMRFGENGTVDTVIFTETSEGHRLIKVKMRSLRIPELGDKFASRHGQKGIVGVLIPQEDMPFTETGLSPDLIINPHAIPSRMTIGQLMELLAGKLAAARGEPVTATAFEGESADFIKDNLHSLGFQRYGRETMYDGRTGEKLKSDVFVGIAFYQKLHHLVNDKIHARARGPVQILTRQPTEGRSREGGLKFGEMERDCLIGHGTALILKERLLDESDKSEELFCENCGFIAQYNRVKDKHECPVCRDETTITPIIISYAFKLLLQELMSLGIAPRVELSQRM